MLMPASPIWVTDLNHYGSKNRYARFTKMVAQSASLMMGGADPHSLVTRRQKSVTPVGGDGDGFVPATLLARERR